jgi:hypothetical protein
MLKPHWIDEVISDAVNKGDADAVAYALAHSDRLRTAIKSAIESGNKMPKNVAGPSKAQHVRQAIVQAMAVEA